MTYVDCAIARGKADYIAGKPLSANHYRNHRDDQCGPQMRHWWRIGWKVACKSGQNTRHSIKFDQRESVNAA